MHAYRAAVFCFLLVLAASTAWSAGYAIWEMGSRSSALGGVGTVSVDDASAVFYNPAGLARLDGSQLHFAVTAIKPYYEFSGVAPDPGYGVTETLDDPFFLLPQGYASRRVTPALALGLGVNTPYGLRIQWKDPANFSGRAISTHSKLTTVFVTPSVAYSPTERLSIGAGLNVVFSSVLLERYIVRNLPDPTYVGRVSIEGDGDTALGFNLGLLLDLDDVTSLGLSYKSRIDLSFDGNADFTAFDPGIPLEDSAGATELPLPSLLSLGIARRFGERLLLEFNFDRIQWSAFDELILVFSDLGVEERIREDYFNTNQFRLGAEYQATPELALRLGGVLDESPQPAGSVGPVLPDADRRGLSLGAGYRRGAVSIDVYNLFLFFEDRQIRSNYDGFNGDYRNYTNLSGVGLHYRF